MKPARLTQQHRPAPLPPGVREFLDAFAEIDADRILRDEATHQRAIPAQRRQAQ